MARRKKNASEMTTEELAKRLFPKPLRDKLQEEVRQSDAKQDKKSSQNKDTT